MTIISIISTLNFNSSNSLKSIKSSTLLNSYSCDTNQNSFIDFMTKVGNKTKDAAEAGYDKIKNR